MTGLRVLVFCDYSLVGLDCLVGLVGGVGSCGEFCWV